MKFFVDPENFGGAKAAEQLALRATHAFPHVRFAIGPEVGNQRPKLDDDAPAELVTTQAREEVVRNQVRAWLLTPTIVESTSPGLVAAVQEVLEEVTTTTGTPASEEAAGRPPVRPPIRFPVRGTSTSSGTPAPASSPAEGSSSGTPAPASSPAEGTPAPASSPAEGSSSGTPASSDATSSEPAA